MANKVDIKLNQELQRKKRDCKKEVLGIQDTKNDAHARAVIGIMEAFSKGEGFIYIEAHLPKNSNKPADIVLCDENNGVVVFEVKGYEIQKIEKYTAGKLIIEKGGSKREESPWDQARDNMFDIKNRYEKNRRSDSFEMPPFSCFAFFPNIESKQWKNKLGDVQLEDTIFQDDIAFPSKLMGKIAKAKKVKSNKNLSLDVINLLKETFGDSEVINSNREQRENILEESLGCWIDEQENLAKNLSIEQQDLSRLELDGRPRLIRGVAGSGKTVVLANMAARAFKRAQNNLFGRGREFKILVLCFNKSFIPHLKEKIKVAFGDEFNYIDKIKIMTVDAFLHDNLIKTKYVDESYWCFENGRDMFKKIWELWEEKKKSNPYIPKYDVIFIDEGQDLSEYQYQLLLDFCIPDYNNKEKNIIIFYDDAQNIYGITTPNWSKIGLNLVGDRTRIMKEGFRTTKEIVNIAFNILLGTACGNERKIKTKSFAEVDTLKAKNLISELSDGYYQVHFAKRESNKYPDIYQFANREEEHKYIHKELLNLIGKESVRPEDILLITFKKEDAEELNKKIEENLKAQKLIKGTIRPYIDEEKGKEVFQKDFLTISTIHSAKGYDAPIVFLFGIDTLNDDEKGRAIFYVGCTRAKYILYLTGAEKNNNTLMPEIKKVIEDFRDKYLE